MFLYAITGFALFFLKTYFHGLFLEELTGNKVFMFRVDKQPDSEKKLEKKFFNKLFLDEHQDETPKALKLRITSNVFSALFIAWLVSIVLIGILKRTIQ
jgi:hypothetical protein